MVPTRKINSPVNVGRKSAYVARNRAALIRSTQEVLAEIGPGATIEQVSKAANLSVTTIYQHFETKELLFETAILSGMHEWQAWVDSVIAEITDPLEELVIPMRLLMRAAETHPMLAQMAAQNQSELPKYRSQISSGFAQHVRELVEKKILKIDDLEIRIALFFAIGLSAFTSQILIPGIKASDADKAIEIGLSILGISEAKARKLAHAKLPEYKK